MGKNIAINIYVRTFGSWLKAKEKFYLANENYNKSMKLIIDYGKLKQNPIKFSGYQECVKRYLFDHVKSPFHYVNPKDWDKALMLPMQKWAVNPDKRYAKAPPY